MINIDNLIADAMKAGNVPAREIYRIIKSKILEYKTRKNAKPYDDNAELAIINKVKNDLQEAITLYEGKSEKLVNESKAQLEVVKTLLPPEVSEDEIKAAVKEFGDFTIKEMGKVIGFVKSKYPTADGSLISKIVKSCL